MPQTGFFRRLFKRLGGRDAVRQLLVGRDPASGYKGPPETRFALLADDLPLFTLYTAEIMLRDPVVRFGLSVRDGAMAPANVEVECTNREMREWVGRQWQSLWGNHRDKLAEAKRYGYSAVQVLWRRDRQTGRLEVDGVRLFSPHDIRPLEWRGRVVGFTARSHGQTAGKRSIYAPRGVWFTFDVRHNEQYGRAILRRAYPPFFEKWMPAGAKKTLQLRLIKDSYLGDVIYYPPGQTVQDTAGNDITWQEYLREMSEYRMAGGSLTLPSLYDKEGRRLVEYNPPVDTGNPEGIYRWRDDCDSEILKGLDVFPEVVEASQTGSGYSGRSIPLIMFLLSVEWEFVQILRAVDEFALRPVAALEFGRRDDYDLRPVSLLETYAEETGGTSNAGPLGGSAGGGGGQMAPPGPNGSAQGPPAQFNEPPRLLAPNNGR